MAQPIEAVKDINDSKDLWKIVVRCKYMWTVTSSSNKQHMDMIQAIVPPYLVSKYYLAELAIGESYIMQNFKEVIHALKRRTKGRKAHLALKIDISKAYDRVDWGFLKEVLGKLGFAEKWIHWLMICVTSTNYSVLVNSERVGPIVPGRGLRQGDPLSPANLTEVQNLMELLNVYAKASGQEINLTKSEVFFSNNLSNPAKEDLASIMGVRHVLGTGRYLGLPSMIGRGKKVIFSYVKDRIWKKINSWSGRSLSRAGKDVMIKSVLQAIPAYVMSLFILPETLISDIEKMLNSFWWGGGTNHKGIRWMAWDKLACPKEEGGLGFRDFRSFNKAMVAKQGWFMLANPLAFVSRIFKARYFPRTSFFEAKLGYNPSFVWKSIWSAREILTMGCRWSIGTGSQINVMCDPWLRGRREGCLQGPQVHGAYNITVNNLMLPNSKQWDMRKLTEMFDCAAVEDIIHVPLLEEVMEDRLIWSEDQSGNYSVRSGYRLWRKAKLNQNVEEGEDSWSILGTTNRGWCVRGAGGSFIHAGVAWDSRKLSILEAGAMALKEAIKDSIALHLDRIIFESDSLTVVTAVHSNASGRSDFYHVIHSIRLLLSSFHNFEVKFVKRQANMVADSLVKAANSWTRRSSLHNVPPCIALLINNEMR
ncbi:uncharacterized protein LOC131648625 [Vicia villosa]|uniref:uncharacterized protein LOC131648625 n=1 Tax=Vicia villosa TaxID=3911 RepID=UPI00273C3D1E|nr:uncharacterized protein LOC131648625 [Vicia villosa]